ncbi:MAG: CDP-alcohol phosphatidyltransferase family protein [Myxococcales bacterium]|nr:CDP-alcohol phosphatidyltransferase family protein [Myxococcales bacterium]
MITDRPVMSATEFRATLKPLEVEEIIDLLVHRPLAHLIVVAVVSTPITPDQLTIVSMLVGVVGGLATLSSYVYGVSHLALGGLLLIASAVVDCSDGQLARLRKSSSVYGRMLDGSVDAVVQVSVVPAALLHVYWRHGGSSLGLASTAALPSLGASWSATTWLVIGTLAVVTGVIHTMLYDVFKNVYLRMTQPGKREGDEDPEDVEAEYAAAKARGLTLIDRFRYGMYRGYLPQQRAAMRALDPYIPSRFRDFPAYSEALAARFRARERGLMRGWSFYGIGTHIFGLGVAMIFDRVEYYILARLFLSNGALIVLIPMQRRASREVFGPGGLVSQLGAAA